MNTFTTKDGSRYEISAPNTWTTITGKQITNFRVNVYNPRSGHGWGGVMRQDEVEMWKGR